MEEKQQQQPLREAPQRQRRAQEPAARHPEMGSALRAAAVLQAGGHLAFARPADVRALGALAGNSALSSLLAAAGPHLVQPFSYRPSAGVSKPAPVHTVPPALCEPAVFPETDAGLEPYPASAFTGGAWA